MDDSNEDDKVDNVHKVYVSIGSNVGNRAMNITRAVSLLREYGDVVKTSFLYESQPMYFTEQSAFLNAACCLHTKLTPVEILSALQSIEKSIGRYTTFRNGPRVIDLDIVLYDQLKLVTADLQIPHPRLHERAFVLKPLVDIDPGLRMPSRETAEQALEHLERTEKLAGTYSELRRVLPLGSFGDGRERLVYTASQILIAGILNATPDSFSDGVTGATGLKVSSLLHRVETMLRDGADVIDIGGESTRPNASVVSEQDELSRVIPLIRAIRDKGLDCIVSIDTRKSIVAQAAIEAGADIINDVSGGRFDSNMLPTMAKLQKPTIMMHSRGDPQTMISTDNCSYIGSSLTDVVAHELLKQVVAVERSGLPTWLTMIDPGIGFAKNASQNVELLAPSNLKHFRTVLGNRPMMVGTSRKRFIEVVMQPESQSRGPVSIPPQERDFGSVSSMLASTLGGAFLLRTHNVAAMNQALTVFRRIVFSGR